MKLWKRTIGFLLTIAMMASMVMVSAFAEETEEMDTQEEAAVEQIVIEEPNEPEETAAPEEVEEAQPEEETVEEVVEDSNPVDTVPEEDNVASGEDETNETESETEAEANEKSEADTEGEVTVYELLLAAPAGSLHVGESVCLNATVTPESATLVWSSSNPDVLSVNQEGVVTACAVGKAVITAAVEADASVFADVVLEVIPEETEGISLADLLKDKSNGGKLSITEDVIVKGNVTIPENVELSIDGGTLTVLTESTLSVLGYGEIKAGKLIVAENAQLENAGFIVVADNGEISVEEGGSYLPQDGAVLILDQSESENAAINGLSHSYVEWIVAVNTQAQFMQAMHENDYAFVTILVPNIAFVSEAGVDYIPDSKCISLMN